MITIKLHEFNLYLDEAYFEDRRARAGAVCALVARPYRYTVECETWSVAKGTLDHVAMSRERAHALIRLVSRLVESGLITQEEAEHVVSEVDWGWCCPVHPLIPLSSAYDICYVCADEEDAEEVVS